MLSKVFHPKMLTLAREARGLSQTQLAELSGVSRSNISRYEQELIQMSDEYLNVLFKTLEFPESLYCYSGELIPPPLYRQRGNLLTRLFDKIEANMNLYHLQLSDLLNRIGHPAATLPVLSTKEDFKSTNAANKLRKHWKLPKGPIRNLAQVAQDNGVFILPFNFESSRVLSASLLINKKYPIIFYNNKLLGDGQRYIIGKELGHLLLHSHSKINTTQKFETEAREFANELLMPEEEFTKEIMPDMDFDQFANLKLKWKVSMQTIFQYTLQLGLLNGSSIRKLTDVFNSRRLRRREPMELDIPLESCTLLRDLLTRYRIKQRLSLSQLAASFHLSEEEFLQRYAFESATGMPKKAKQLEYFNN